jgi:hypothetical protein
MLGYGYRSWIAIPGQHCTLFHGVMGMLVTGLSLLLSTMMYAAHPMPLPHLKSETEVSAGFSGADNKVQMTESSFGLW